MEAEKDAIEAEGPIAPGDCLMKAVRVENTANIYERPMYLRHPTHHEEGVPMRALANVFEHSDAFQIIQTTDEFTDVDCPPGSDPVLLFPELSKFALNASGATKAILVNRKVPLKLLESACVVRFKHDSPPTKLEFVRFEFLPKAPRPVLVSALPEEGPEDLFARPRGEEDSLQCGWPVADGACCVQ